jgi:oxygen-independent coproporphyrinogen-3 oxidase
VARSLPVSADDELRAGVIERLMCDLTVDVGAECRDRGFEISALDAAIAAASALERDGLCRVEGRTVTITEEAFRLMRVVAACFDAGLAPAERRHARAV